MGTSSTTQTTSTPTRPIVSGDVLRVTYVNVGQGDGIVWQLPGGAVVVYDCGPAATAATNPVTAYLRSIGLPAGSHIHALIASHGHLDHIAGCEEVLAEYVVDHVYDTWYTGTDAPQSYTTFRSQVTAEATTLHDIQDDPSVADVQFQQWDDLGLPGAVSAQIMWPPLPALNWDHIAEASIAIRLTLGSVDFCFQGDIETAQEASLATESRDLNCEVFLGGHHGSRYATSSPWLSKMDPEYAPVSFGTNSYGHPTADALCRLQAAGAAIYATHRLGTITIQTDGTQVEVMPATPETANYCSTGADYWSTSPGGTPPPPAPPAGLAITSVVADSVGDDLATNAGEYAEITNSGNVAADLTGWTISDLAGAIYTFPTHQITAGGVVRVHTGPGTASATDLFWGRGSSVWNNDHDTAYLRDPTGSLVDDHTY